MKTYNHARLLRRWALHTAALVLAAGVGVLTGHATWQHPAPVYAGCIYGGLHMKDGDVATSSVRGVDVKCDNGSIDRYIPTAK